MVGGGCPVLVAADVGNPVAVHSQDLPALPGSAFPTRHRRAGDVKPDKKSPRAGGQFSDERTGISGSRAAPPREELIAVAAIAVLWPLRRTSAGAGAEEIPEGIQGASLQGAPDLPGEPGSRCGDAGIIRHENLPCTPQLALQRRRAGACGMGMCGVPAESPARPRPSAGQQPYAKRAARSMPGRHPVHQPAEPAHPTTAPERRLCRGYGCVYGTHDGRADQPILCAALYRSMGIVKLRTPSAKWRDPQSRPIPRAPCGHVRVLGARRLVGLSGWLWNIHHVVLSPHYVADVWRRLANARDDYVTVIRRLKIVTRLNSVEQPPQALPRQHDVGVGGIPEHVVALQEYDELYIEQFVSDEV
jgi:hypothetical protein